MKIKFTKYVLAAIAISIGFSLKAQVPLLKYNFDEGTGSTTASSGSLNDILTLTATSPVWSANVPTGKSGGSLDFGTIVGKFVAESSAPIEALKGLSSFTITGWINNNKTDEGGGGNRIVTWINDGGDGVDLVYHSNGSLQMGINQWPDGGAPLSSADVITTDPDAGVGNWVFFAVTYNSADAMVRYYIGNSQNDAALDTETAYAQGVIGQNIGKLAIGHFNDATRNNAADRMVRGLVDNIAIFSSDLSLADIISVQKEAPSSVISVESVSLDQATYEFKVGESVKVFPTVLPYNASNRKVTYTISPSGIASIDAKGKLTGLATGTATLTVTTDEGSKTASSTVNVKSATELLLTGIQFDNIDPYGGAGTDGAVAFDGSTANFVDANAAGGGYTGLNFGRVLNITKIKFFPRNNWAGRMNGGKFQGSNNDIDYTDIYTLNDTPASDVWTELTVNENYQYVRYLSPDNGYCNVSEIEFWSTIVPVKILTGTNFNNNNSDPSRTGAAAFDGSTATFVDDNNANGGYTGINLESVKNITKIKFFPRNNWAGRMNGGKFQGSNNNVDYTDIYTLNNTPASDVWTELVVNENYQYIRYLSPDGGYCNVAEIEFWTPIIPLKILTGTNFNNNDSDPARTGAAAFDGDTLNFVDDNNAGGGYTGLNFGSVKNITEIRFFPRNNWAGRMNGGKFQGSNDNTNYTDIYTIPTTPVSGWNEVEVHVNYQYMRYLSPDGGYCNVAEIEFLTPVTNVAVTGVSLVESAISLSVAELRQLSAVVTPSNASNTSLTWSSENDLIATVSNTGMVKGVAVGSVKITVTTVDGNFKAEATVNVLKREDAIENFDYPIGDIDGKGTATNGWGGPWVKASGEMDVVAGNLGDNEVGNSAQTIANPAVDWTGYYRDINWMDDGSDIWISFDMIRAKTDVLSWGGLSLFNGDSEDLFMGCPNESAFVGFDSRPTTVDNTVVNFVTVKLEMTGTAAKDKAYMWVNYAGASAPDIATADQNQEWGTTGITKIRIANDKSYSISYDKLRIASTFAAGNPITGINYNRTGRITAYPNPVSNHLQLSVNADKIIVYSIDGKPVIETKGNNLNMDNLAPGMYFLKVSLNHDVETIKVVKK